MKIKKTTKKPATRKAIVGAPTAATQVGRNGTSVASPEPAAGGSATLSSSAAEDDPEFHLAFQRVESEIKAVDASRFITINLDLRMVVTTIVGAYPEIRALRPIIATLGTVDIACVDKLLDYALALGHAHTLYMLTTEVRDEIAAFAAEGIAIRDQLRADAATLAKRGLINPDLLARLQNGISYPAIAFDLVAISETLLEAWPRLQGKVAFEHADLTQARSLGNRMVKLVGQREQAPVAREKSAIVRQQAFTLCAETYEEVRLAVGFARRHEGDGENIAPSLFQVRGRRNSSDNAPVAPAGPPVVSPNAPESPGSPGATNGAPAVSGPAAASAVVSTPAASNSAASNSAASNSAASNVPVGHPGSAAFKR